jgi:hypothetical protein
MKLAIAIPTFNRSSSIRRRITEISNISESGIEVWISDNSSDDETTSLVKNTSNVPIKYKKNDWNIGGGANFLQSLLLGNSEYVWLRGDDDPITSNQLRAVQKAVSLNPDVIILSRNATQVESIRTIREFFTLFKLTQASGWLSMIVFKQSSLGVGLKWGYWGIRSGWANVCLVLGVLRDSPSPLCLVVPVSLVASDFREDGRKSRSWSVIQTCVDNFPTTFDMIPLARDRHHALYHWRKSQGLSLIRTYARSRLGLAPYEKLTTITFLNLLSPHNPGATLTAFMLLVLRIVPRTLLTLIFVVLSLSYTQELLQSLELEDLSDLGFFERLALLRRKQASLYLSSSFL